MMSLPIRSKTRSAAGAGVILGLSVATLLGAAPAGANTGAPTTSPCVAYAVPAPGYAGSALMTMNDSGLYIGAVQSADGVTHAAYWRHAPGTDPASGWSLTVPPLPTDTEFLDVNASGVMTGFAGDLGQGFVYDSTSGGFQWMPDFQGGSFDYPRRINDAGEIVGQAVGPAPDYSAYGTWWRPPYTVANRVGVPGETQNVTYTDDAGVVHHVQLGSTTYGINNQGTIAGFTGLGGPADDASLAARGHFWRNGIAPLYQPFTKDMHGHFNRLPGLGDQSYVWSINDAGVVVGESYRGGIDTPIVPVAWVNGRVIDLGSPSDVVHGESYDVSPAGWVVGGVNLADGTARSFVWTGSGTMEANAPLPGDTSTWSHGVDDLLHQIAGYSQNDATGVNHATVWQCPSGFTTG